MTQPSTAPVTVVRAALRESPGLWDLTLAEGRITAIEQHGSPTTATTSAGGTVIDADGRAATPGLTDHHLHVLAAAAALESVSCGRLHSHAELHAALARAEPGMDGWIRAVGYDETTAGDLDAATLDAARADVPLRLQHRSGALWVVNGRGVDLLGLATSTHPGVERDAAGHPTGRLWRADDLIVDRLGHRPPDLASLGRALLRHGITTITDATPDADDAYLARLAAALDSGDLAADVLVLGTATPTHPRLKLGPRKIVLADSGLPEVDDLVAAIGAAHRSGRSVALHCVSVEAYLIAHAAWSITGVRHGDRIEHLAVLPHVLLPDLAELAAGGPTVVTQPGFLADRGSLFAREHPTYEHGDLYRLGSLISAGVPVALSSDAPYGPLDPWQVIAAATSRRTDAGEALGPDEAIDLDAALDRYLTPATHPGGVPRSLTVGAPADLVVWDRSWAELRERPDDTSAAVVVDRGAGVHVLGRDVRQ